MKEKTKTRKKALRAMKAVTAGAILFAGVACSDDDTGSTGWNIDENDAGDDVATSNADSQDTELAGDTGAADSGSDTEVVDAGSDIGPADTGADTGPDASDTGASDAGTDIGSGDTGTDASDTDVGDPDSGQDCNAKESTGDCPDHCHMDNDVDCCEEIGGFWSDGFCSVAVPGPFVPPAMPV